MTITDQTTDLDELRDALLILTPAQEKAVEQLALGASHLVAAQAADVARETVGRWLAHHPGFRAALARWRMVLASEEIDRSRRIRQTALDRVEKLLPDADLDHVLAVLRAVPAVDSPDSIESALPHTHLEQEISVCLMNLPPEPPLRREDGTIDQIRQLLESGQGLTPYERAEQLTIERLAWLAEDLAVDDDEVV